MTRLSVRTTAIDNCGKDEQQLTLAADIAAASDRLQGIVNELRRVVGYFRL